MMTQHRPAKPGTCSAVITTKQVPTRLMAASHKQEATRNQQRHTKPNGPNGPTRHQNLQFLRWSPPTVHCMRRRILQPPR